MEMTRSALVDPIFEHMVNNYVSEEERAKILSSLKEDKVMASLLDRILFPPPTPKKVVDKVQKKEKKKKKETSDRKTTPKVSLEERQSSEVDHERCLCRLWKNGLDNVQCSRMKKEGDFCTAHSKIGADWWCGLITEPRPEEPCLPNKKDPSAPPARHYWKDQEQPAKRSKKSKKVEEKKEVEVEEKKEEKVVEVEEKKEEKVEEKKVEEKVEEKKVEEKVEEKKDDPIESSHEVEEISSPTPSTASTVQPLDSDENNYDAPSDIDSDDLPSDIDSDDDE
jgi:hypothetical protein